MIPCEANAPCTSGATKNSSTVDAALPATARRQTSSGKDFSRSVGDGGSADDIAPFAHDDRQPRTREIGGGNEAVVSGADDDGAGSAVGHGMRPVMTRVSLSSPCVLLMSV